MANPEHVAKLKEGVWAWNEWREENPYVEPDFRTADLRSANLVRADLSEADFRGANLVRADLSGAVLRKANLRRTKLHGADLSYANLTGANLGGAYLFKANLSGSDLRGATLHKTVLFEANLLQANLHKADLKEANLSGADLRARTLQETVFLQANLFQADLRRVDLRKADLREANLEEADLSGADLRKADLREANLEKADLSGTDLSGANLSQATLVRTNLERAILTGCSVYGISAWDIRLEGAIQSDLVITPDDESAIQVDNLEVAQFIYLLLNNARIRHVIDTITSKVVLILGRFTPDRKVVLEAIREELRKQNYLPVLFDFEKPDSKDITGTVTTLANMARFVIADLTDPASVPHELAMIVPSTIVPVQTIFLEGQREYAMFRDLKMRYHWLLEPYEYESESLLLAQLEKKVIGPAEAKAKELIQK